MLLAQGLGRPGPGGPGGGACGKGADAGQLRDAGKDRKWGPDWAGHPRPCWPDMAPARFK